MRALLSVYEKKGIVEFARELVSLGFEILSSGGTAKVLAEASVPVRDVAEFTGFKPVLRHRVVTLAPQIHGGLLAADVDLAELEALGWPMIDLVCVDLYPLKEAIRNSAATHESVIEKTDVGGPTMLRSAAKGGRIVICDPADRERVIERLKANNLDGDFKRQLAARAEGVCADYCLESARYHSGGKIDGMVGTQVLACKYGENGWQTPAALFSTGTGDPLGLDKFVLVAGTPPSYNNMCDLERLLQTATHIAASSVHHGPDEAIAVAVKHGNSCGAAHEIAAPRAEPGLVRLKFIVALTNMIEGDQRAIFGGLVLVNFGIDEELAEAILTHEMPKNARRLLDGIIAPSFTSEAIDLLRRKGDKCRFLANPALATSALSSLDAASRFRYVRGGFLRQPNYTFVPDWNKLPLHPRDVIDVPLAWAIGSTSNSNTITLVKGGMLIGNGVGQQDRVGCCELALKRARDAGHDPKGAVAYSDSFFPFPDGVQVLIDAGIRSIFTTSGSVNDPKTREACEKANVQLYMLPDAAARGFFGH